MYYSTHRGSARDPQDLARLLVSRANSGDIEGMAALYEPGAVLALGNGRLAIGTDAIRRYYTEFLATGVKFNVGDQRPALISGDIALTSTRLPNGAVTAEIARKQRDGTWLWVVDQPSLVGA
jgi:ketosteroid isomerase-like protein